MNVCIKQRTVQGFDWTEVQSTFIFQKGHLTSENKPSGYAPGVKTTAQNY